MSQIEETLITQFIFCKKGTQSSQNKNYENFDIYRPEPNDVLFD